MYKLENKVSRWIVLVIVAQKFIEIVRGRRVVFLSSMFRTFLLEETDDLGTRKKMERPVVEKQMLSPEDNKLSSRGREKRSLLDRDSGREKESVFLLPLDCAPTARSLVTLSVRSHPRHRVYSPLDSYTLRSTKEARRRLLPFFLSLIFVKCSK